MYVNVDWLVSIQAIKNKNKDSNKKTCTYSTILILALSVAS